MKKKTMMIVVGVLISGLLAIGLLTNYQNNKNKNENKNETSSQSTNNGGKKIEKSSNGVSIEVAG